MKPIAYYTTRTLSIPLAKDYTTVYAYSKGKVIWQGPAREWEKHGQHIGTSTVEKVLDEAEYKKARRAYRDEGDRLIAEFKADLFDDAGVTDHPKAQRVFALAWEYGHDAGLGEVANYFDDLVDLIKD